MENLDEDISKYIDPADIAHEEHKEFITLNLGPTHPATHGVFQNILTMDENERTDLANILKAVLLKYDNLWGMPLPYMMIMHQAPTDGKDYPGYHFNIQFHPPNRPETKLKYLAGCETGAGTYINDTLAEEKAEDLRKSEPSTVENTYLKIVE